MPWQTPSLFAACPPAKYDLRVTSASLLQRVGWNMKLLGFDIEISNVFDLKPNEDLEKYAPFDISVAATEIRGGEQLLWLSKDSNSKPELNLTREDALKLLEYLDQMQRANHALVAWNGLSFDLKWIGH